MKKMAEPLYKDFQCIFFDQRGSGQSKVENYEQSSFQLDLMLGDITAVQEYYKTGACMLVGHSWGAMYGLFACMKSPNHFTKAALLNMGPLDSEAAEQNSAHLLKVLNLDEQETWKTLRQKRNQAREQGDSNTVHLCDKELMHLRVRSWIFDPALHETFLTEYFSEPPPNRDVNKWVWDSLEGWFSWDQIHLNTTPTCLIAGANDATPLSQMKRIDSLLPNCRLRVYEKCGHIPWMEHPHSFYSDLTSFLK